MDVNEKIVREWLHLCERQFTIENIQFKTVGPKGGVNYSDIDILATDGKGNFFDYEVKWRSVYSVSATDRETISYYIKQMKRPERAKAIRQLIGNKKICKIFVTTKVHFGKNPQKREQREQELRKAGIKICYFENIITDLVKVTELKGRHDSPILQTIRMLDFCGMIKHD